MDGNSRRGAGLRKWTGAEETRAPDIEGGCLVRRNTEKTVVRIASPDPFIHFSGFGADTPLYAPLPPGKTLRFEMMIPGTEEIAFMTVDFTVPDSGRLIIGAANPRDPDTGSVSYTYALEYPIGE